MDKKKREKMPLKSIANYNAGLLLSIIHFQLSKIPYIISKNFILNRMEKDNLPAPKGVNSIYILSVGSQKGAITIQKCSAVNQKGAITIYFVQR